MSSSCTSTPGSLRLLAIAYMPVTLGSTMKFWKHGFFEGGPSVKFRHTGCRYSVVSTH